jgi:hypothetical protein
MNLATDLNSDRRMLYVKGIRVGRGPRFVSVVLFGSIPKNPQPANPQTRKLAQAASPATVHIEKEDEEEDAVSRRGRGGWCQRRRQNKSLVHLQFIPSTMRFAAIPFADLFKIQQCTFTAVLHHACTALSPPPPIR